MNTHSFALLFDKHISYRIVKSILHLFPGSEAVKRLGLAAKEDHLIWEATKKSSLAIITYGDDYALLNQLRGWPPKVILIRSDNLSNDYLVTILGLNFVVIFNFLLDKEFNAQGVLELYRINSN